MQTNKETKTTVGYTKGEWKITKVVSPSFDYDIESEEADTTIAAIYSWSVEGYDEEAEANAKLISAAPDLLEALQDLVNTLQPLENNPISYWLMGKAYSAIKKAT